MENTLLTSEQRIAIWWYRSLLETSMVSYMGSLTANMPGSEKGVPFDAVLRESLRYEDPMSRAGRRHDSSEKDIAAHLAHELRYNPEQYFSKSGKPLHDGGYRSNSNMSISDIRKAVPGSLDKYCSGLPFRVQEGYHAEDICQAIKYGTRGLSESPLAVTDRDAVIEDIMAIAAASNPQPPSSVKDGHGYSGRSNEKYSVSSTDELAVVSYLYLHPEHYVTCFDYVSYSNGRHTHIVLRYAGPGASDESTCVERMRIQLDATDSKSQFPMRNIIFPAMARDLTGITSKLLASIAEAGLDNVMAAVEAIKELYAAYPRMADAVRYEDKLSVSNIRNSSLLEVMEEAAAAPVEMHLRFSGVTEDDNKEGNRLFWDFVKYGMQNGADSAKSVLSQLTTAPSSDSWIAEDIREGKL